jgi:hypothetical protein
MPNKITKPDLILKLISRKSGAALAQLAKSSGWKMPSVHAALTGLRKKGHEITRTKNRKGVTVYSIADGDTK